MQPGEMGSQQGTIASGWAVNWTSCGALAGLSLRTIIPNVRDLSLGSHLPHN